MDERKEGIEMLRNAGMQERKTKNVQRASHICAGAGKRINNNAIVMLGATQTEYTGHEQFMPIFTFYSIKTQKQNQFRNSRMRGTVISHRT